MQFPKLISERNTRASAGSNGSWRLERTSNDEYVLVHYATPMLSWYDHPDGVVITGYSVGHGSVSDQGGMNVAFRVLGVPYRYYRDWHGGGPRITELTESVTR